MTKFLSVTVGILILATTSMAQDYLPLATGNKWYYKVHWWEASEKIPPMIYKQNGKKYFLLIDSTPEVVIDTLNSTFQGDSYPIYITGRKGLAFETLFLRKDKKGNVYSYDRRSNLESLYLPHRIKKGKTWLSADKQFEYEIVSAKGTFSTSSFTFEDCLVISTKSIDRHAEVYYHYYYKGIGMVGTKVEDKVIIELLKWELGNAR
jgi:hypothetical protein